MSVNNSLFLFSNPFESFYTPPEVIQRLAKAHAAVQKKQPLSWRWERNAPAIAAFAISILAKLPKILRRTNRSGLLFQSKNWA